MKRRNLTRGASILFALTLITTSIIGGTFAKYTTSGSVSETARVANFGVTVSAKTDQKLFGTTYINGGTYSKKDSTATEKLTINSSSGTTDDYVVAPGSANEEGITFTVSGTPEVAVKIELRSTAEATNGIYTDDIFLLGGTDKVYRDRTTAVVTDEADAKYEDTFPLSNTYYPIKYRLTNDTTGKYVEGRITDIAGKDADGNPNTLLLAEFPAGDTINNTKYTLTWYWDLSNVVKNDKGDVVIDADKADKADTVLGDLAAGEYQKEDNTLDPGTDYNLKTAVELEVVVTQINEITGKTNAIDPNEN
jgi:hypothetical protein